MLEAIVRLEDDRCTELADCFVGVAVRVEFAAAVDEFAAAMESQRLISSPFGQFRRDLTSGLCLRQK